MKKRLVLGIGSTFGDDELGWMTIKRLENLLTHRSEHDKGVDLITVDRSDPLLLDLMRQYDHCILVDTFLLEGASVSGNHSIVREIDLSEIETMGDNFSSHGFGLGQTLQLGKSIGMLPRRLEIIGIGITPGELDDSKRSECIEFAIGKAVEKTRCLIENSHS